MKLRIANNLTLPADFVTSTQAILAQKGKGKTYTAQVEAEELLEAGQQVVVIDPTDAWYGLRSSPDGRSTGYSIPVFGGDHADAPLEPGAGALLAEAIASEHFSAIICTENLTKGQEHRFGAEFFETLYRKNRTALHLFVDEADIFAPQKPFGPDETKALGALDSVVRRGRKKGLGCTLISQRPAVLNKNVLSQVDQLIAMGMLAPPDLDQIENWVSRHDKLGVGAEMIASLPDLPRGEAWVWNPAADIFKRVTIRAKTTFDSGATPKPGEKVKVAKVLAPVDLKRLGERMASAVERAKAEDPKALRARIAELEKAAPRAPGRADREVERLTAQIDKLTAELAERKRQKPVTETMAKRLAASVEKFAHMSRRLEGVAGATRVYTDEIRALLARNLGLDPDKSHVDKPVDSVVKMPGITSMSTAEKVEFAERLRTSPAQRWQPSRAVPKPPPAPRDASSSNGHSGIGPSDRAFLNAIAWWNMVGVRQPTMRAVGFVAGQSAKSSAFENRRSKLRSAGLIDYPAAGLVELTAEGSKVADHPATPGTLTQLQDRISEQLDPADRAMLRALISAWPQALSAEDLAQRTGASHKSSAFENRRSRLSGLGLVTYPQPGFVVASELVFPPELT